MKHEITKETSTKTCEGKKCMCGHHIGKILIGIIILALFSLTICNTIKVNKIYSATIAQYGNEENFNEYLKLMQAPQVAEQAKQALEGIKSQLGIDAATEQQPTEEVENTESTGEALETTAAYSDPKWNANALEAKTHFEMEGTPANAIINIKSGNFKAIAGAYPKEQFDATIATLKKGAAQSDEAGKAGTLTQEQIKAILNGAHYFANEGAEIVIVEYTDLLCPFCQRHYDAKTLENIVNADKGVALIIKNMPLAQLHPTAPIGAKGVECAGQLGGSKAYYDYIAKAFTYSTFNGTNVAEIANSIGLDGEAFAACFTK